MSQNEKPPSLFGGMHKSDVRSGAVVSLSGVLANAGLVLVLAAVYVLGWGAIRRGRARRVASKEAKGD